MLEHIESILRERCGLIKEAPIVAGISGGPDSLCLLNVLHSAGYRVIVAHFNHMLRPDADADANLVEKIAARLNLKWIIGKGDVRQYADAQKMSIEEAARMMRYQFLMEQARRNGAQAVAVGHTADDQAETVLMNFLRGTGLTGLKGMLYRATIRAFDAEIPIVRPLLDVWREETIVYCAESGLHPRYDPTNASLDFFRNRLRHALIPTLETYNPRFREALWRMSRALTDDYEILSRTLDEDWKQTVAQEDKDFIAFNASALEMRPAGLRRNLIRRAIERLQVDSPNVNFSMLERAAQFISDPAHPVRLDLLRGFYLWREDAFIYLTANESSLPIERWPQLSDERSVIALNVPGQTALPGGWMLTCELWSIASLAVEAAKSNKDPFQAWLDAEQISGALTLRARQGGDRFTPLGMNGDSIKLSDFFVNVKLPQRARARWPLLCAGGVIAWAPGYRPAHPFRLTASTRQALYFSLTRH